MENPTPTTPETPVTPPAPVANPEPSVPPFMAQVPPAQVQPLETSSPASPTPPPMKKTSPALILGLLALLLAAGGAGAYWYWQNMTPASNQVVAGASPTPNSSPTPELDPVNGNIVAQPSPSPSATKTYTDPQGLFSVSYPDDYTFEAMTQPPGVRMFKQGPSQRGQTEMYDGVLVHLEVIDLAGQSMQAYVDAELAAAESSGVEEVAEPPKAGTFNGYPSITYTTRGLGTFSNIMVQKDANSTQAIKITSLLIDPTGVGFEAQARGIFDSIKILK